MKLKKKIKRSVKSLRKGMHLSKTQFNVLIAGAGFVAGGYALARNARVRSFLKSAYAEVTGALRAPDTRLRHELVGDDALMPSPSMGDGDSTLGMRETASDNEERAAEVVGDEDTDTLTTYPRAG